MLSLILNLAGEKLKLPGFPTFIPPPFLVPCPLLYMNYILPKYANLFLSNAYSSVGNLGGRQLGLVVRRGPRRLVGPFGRSSVRPCDPTGFLGSFAGRVGLRQRVDPRPDQEGACLGGSGVRPGAPHQTGVHAWRGYHQTAHREVFLDTSKLTRRPVGSSTTILGMPVVCPDGVIDGRLITKDKRQEVFGQVGGGAGSTEPEQFQRRKIAEGTGHPCPKTNTRIHLRQHYLREVPFPNKKPDGFDYSEDFDGIQVVGPTRVFVNLKCIVGKGGSQTRSLREVYWFVEGQLHVLQSLDPTERSSTFFANILDGDEAHAVLEKFRYLLALPTFADVRSHVYVGDLKGYFSWFQEHVAPSGQ